MLVFLSECGPLRLFLGWGRGAVVQESFLLYERWWCCCSHSPIKCHSFIHMFTHSSMGYLLCFTGACATFLLPSVSGGHASALKITLQKLFSVDFFCISLKKIPILNSLVPIIAGGVEKFMHLALV